APAPARTRARTPVWWRPGPRGRLQAFGFDAADAVGVDTIRGIAARSLRLLLLLQRRGRGDRRGRNDGSGLDLTNDHRLHALHRFLSILREQIRRGDRHHSSERNPETDPR